MNNATIQKAESGRWLYMDEQDKRLFRKVVIRPSESTAWATCSDAEKIQWEIDHPETIEQPIEVEV